MPENNNKSQSEFYWSAEKKLGHSINDEPTHKSFRNDIAALMIAEVHHVY